MKDKIALEEHISTIENNRYWDSESEGIRNGKKYMEYIERHLLDPSLRLDLMDQYGVELMILSLTSPGVQSFLNANEATEFAKRTNDLMAKQLLAGQSRFMGFATVALQDPTAAADELERAVTQLNMKGALINGYTNVEDDNTGQYLDEPPIWEFWERASKLNVPIYLHPREPLPTQIRNYENYASLIGSAWGFAHETATHAVRLMLSGLFDKYPQLTVILGHLGEGLPFLLPRLQHRLHKQRNGAGLGQATKTVSEYFSQNFYITTSGHFHTKALVDSIAEIGIDRVMFSVDTPYEDVEEAATWFDDAVISDNDRQKIGRENAVRLFSL